MDTMQLTVIGCSGSLGGPHSAPSCYLLEVPGLAPIVMDLGPGALGQLQKYVDPGTITLMLSHLHADHCLDVPSWLVWRRYSPGRQAYSERATVFAPRGADVRLGQASSEDPAVIDDISDTVDLRVWDPDTPTVLDGPDGPVATVSVARVCHPPLAYGIRVQDGAGRSLTFSGDTAFCSELIDLARGTEVLLCEACWEHEGDHPEDMHMSGREAGRTAAEAEVGTLVLTHIPPWTDREAIFAEARAEFSGTILLAEPGLRVPVGPA